MDDGPGGCIVGAFGAVLLLVGMMVGAYIGTEHWKQQAVKHKAATYTATELGEVEFHWNDETKEKP